MVSSRYSLIAFDSNSDTVLSMRSTGTFLCGEMARNQSGRLSGSMWRNSKRTFFSRSTMAARCTHGQVLKLTRRYFGMTSSLSEFGNSRRRYIAEAEHVSIVAAVCEICGFASTRTAQPLEPRVNRASSARVSKDLTPRQHIVWQEGRTLHLGDRSVAGSEA